MGVGMNMEGLPPEWPLEQNAGIGGYPRRETLAWCGYIGSFAECI